MGVLCAVAVVGLLGAAPGAVADPAAVGFGVAADLGEARAMIGAEQPIAAQLEPGSCTAMGVVVEDVIWWSGCPSNSCGGVPACQLDDVSVSPRWTCECDGGSMPRGRCQSKVTVNDDGSIPPGGWSCVNHACSVACTLNEAPPSGAFYFCDCTVIPGGGGGGE